MGIEQVLIMGVVLVIVFALFVVLFDMIMPLVVKGQFDDVCRTYLLLSEAQNGLEYAEIEKLTLELEQIGIGDLELSYRKKHEVVRGGIHAFEVLGIYRYDKMQTLFKREQVELVFKFKRDFIARKIVQ